MTKEVRQGMSRARFEKIARSKCGASYSRCFAVIAGLTLTALTAVADDYFWNNAEGGSWSTISNWKLGTAGAGGDATELPGEDDTVYFCTGEYTISLSADTRVGKLTLENRDRNPACTVHFQLNGHALTTADTTLVDGDVSHGWATMTFTNGCVYSEKGMTVGQQNNASWRGVLQLDDVICAVTNNLTVQGATPQLIIRNGACVSCGAIGGQVKRLADSVTIEGAGTAVDITADASFAGPHRVCIKEDAFVRSSKNISFGGYYQDVTDKFGPSVVIDHAIVTNTGVKTSLNIGQETLTTTVILTNNAQLSSFGYGYIGCSRENSGYIGHSNRLEIVEGSSADFNGWESATTRTCDGLTLGTSISRGNVLYVKNGMYKARFLVVSGKPNGVDNWVHVAGTNSLVKTIAGHYTGYSMRVSAGSGIRFDIGKEGYCQTPIQITGSNAKFVSQHSTDEGYESYGARLVLDCKEFDLLHPEERLTLITAQADSSTGFQDLIDNCTFLHTAGNPGSLTIENGGKSLVYTAPKKRGLMLILR